MRNSLSLFLFILLINSCISRLDFDTGDLNKGTLIVEGYISDQPGPYTINLFQSSNVDDNLLASMPVPARRVSLSDNLGNEEVLSSGETGVYKTKEGGIQGVVGRAYSLHIELIDGSVFDSAPDELLPSGNIDSLYAEWESVTSLTAPPRYGFRVFLDATKDANPESFMRWRYTGVYRFRSYPDLHHLYEACALPPDPLPCSGAILKSGLLTYVDNCTCCICWNNQNEPKPHLMDDAILTNGSAKKVDVGFIPFDAFTFSLNKYMAKVEQMSLSATAYQFWNLIKDQKEGLTSLFQPAFGSIKTNFHSDNSSRKVIGMFYATSIKTRVLFVTSKDAPISVPVPDLDYEKVCTDFWDACNHIYVDAHTTPPPEWE